MERQVVLLKQLRADLAGWFDVIRRSTGAREVRIELDSASGLSIVGVWYIGTGVRRYEHKKTFAFGTLFGESVHHSDAGRHLVKRPCDCAREYILEILEKRGVV